MGASAVLIRGELDGRAGIIKCPAPSRPMTVSPFTATVFRVSCFVCFTPLTCLEVAPNHPEKPRVLDGGEPCRKGV